MKTAAKSANLAGLILLAFVAITAMSSCGKKGCTDPKATNYDADATKYDGSCEYESIDDVITITDNGNGTGTTTWYATKTYVLDGFVFVNNGQTLTIEPGTVIKGKSGAGSAASALIVARGGTIMAEGTAENPIIMTFENDPLDGSVSVNTKGQWGGLIVLGSASLNSNPGETQIEGIPTSEPRGLYGGSDDSDDSGIITYMSIRHGGTDIGAGNEINGLTLGGVGSGTTIEHIEVISNKDDGIEFFGGTVGVKWIVTAFCGDDSYDYDEGFRGKGQFWLTMQDGTEGDRGGEHDGGTDPETAQPYAHPVIYNATYIGSGISSGKRAITFRDNAGGEYHNSIFFNWGKGIDIENLASGEDSYSRMAAGHLVLEGNVFHDVVVAGTGAAASDLFKVTMGSGWSTQADSVAAETQSKSSFQATFGSNNNSVENTGLAYSFSAGGINVVPSGLSSGTAPSGSWFSAVTYKGAFDPASSTTWLEGWTKLDEAGYLQ